jgi:hypothetical protein
MHGVYYIGPLGLVLQLIAIVHFIKRRPDGYWLWVIFIGGWLGALVYIAIEVIPDLGLLGNTFRGFSRRSRIHQLEAMVLDNPSAGNYEELGELYLDEGKFARARQCFDKAISSRTDSPDPFYRRALAALGMNDTAAAVPDLERVFAIDPKYDFHRAAGLLAHGLAQTGQSERAARLFAQVTEASTLSETHYNYAAFLARQGHHDQAREIAQRLLAKKVTMPHFMKRRDRPWFRRANALLKQLPARASQ